MGDEARVDNTENLLISYEEGLYCICMFDAPVIKDAQLAVSMIQTVLDRGVAGFVLFDLRHLRSLDPAPFLHVSEPILQHRQDLIKITRGFAIVHQGGQAAAAVAGGITMYFQNSFPVQAFEDIDTAFQWMGYGGAHLKAHEERVQTFRNAPSVTRDARQYIEDRVLEADLEGFAAHVGKSVADLQRELTAAGTSFRTELRDVRMEIAKDLLVNTNDSMATIGEKVGYKKQQNFTDAFRKTSGMTPSAWRRLQTSGKS